MKLPKLLFVLFLMLNCNCSASDTTEVGRLIKLLDEKFEKDADSCIILAKKVIDISGKLSFNRGLYHGYEYLSRCYRKQSRKNESVETDEILLHLLKDSKNYELLGRTYRRQARSYTDLGAYAKAITGFVEAYKMFQLSGNKAEQAMAIFLMGGVHERAESLESALKSYREAFKLFSAMNDSSRIGMCYVAIGTCYSRMNRQNEAFEYLEKAVGISKRSKDSDSYVTSLNNLGIAYKKSGAYKKASDCYLECLDVSRKLYPDDLVALATVQSNLGNLFILRKDFKTAEGYLNEALRCFDITKDLVGLSEVYQGLYHLEKAKGNYKKSLEYLVLYNNYHDSIVNLEKSASISEIQARFDLDSKNKEIEILNQQASLKENELLTQKIVRNTSIVGSLIFLLFSIIAYRNYQRKNKINLILSKQNEMIMFEQKKSDDLLLNILPYETAQELKDRGHADARKYGRVTVMFTDFVNFTKLAEQLDAETLVQEIHVLFTEFDRITGKYNIEKIKTIGDAYMCAAGLPLPMENDAEVMIDAAIEIRDFIDELRKSKLKEKLPIWDIRIGIHTGPVVAGIVGTKKFAYDIWGDTVNIASRMETASEPGKINISGETFRLTANKFLCKYRGNMEVKNKGQVDMYFVEGKNT